MAMLSVIVKRARWSTRYIGAVQYVTVGEVVNKYSFTDKEKQSILDAFKAINKKHGVEFKPISNEESNRTVHFLSPKTHID